MDILKESKDFIRRVAEADRKAADLRARAADIERELAFPLSAGVSKMEPGRARGQHKSSVEAMAIKREHQQEQAAALLHEAEQMQQERAYAVGFLEYLKRLPSYWSVGNVLEYRYLKGQNVRETSRATFWSIAEVKRLEEKGLMCIGAVFLGLKEPGAIYDRNGLFIMSEAEWGKTLKKWQ